MKINNNQINIQEKEISLKSLNQQDAVGRWWQWFNDKEVTKFMNKGHNQNTPEQQLDFFNKVKNSNQDCVLGIFYNKNNKHIGTTAIHNIRYESGIKKGNFGIIIGEKFFWGKGYGTQAWRMMTNFAFNTLDLNVIETKVFSSNESSLKVAKKIGFEPKRLVKNDIIKDGKMIDRIILELKKNV